MNAAYSVTVRGVDLYVELAADESIENILVGDQEITPLLSDLVVCEIYNVVLDRMEARSAAEKGDRA